MYRLIVTMYERPDRRVFDALFEHDTGRKIERLAKQGKTEPRPEPVRKLSHAEAYDLMDSFVRVFWDCVPACLDDSLDLDH